MFLFEDFKVFVNYQLKFFLKNKKLMLFAEFKDHFQKKLLQIITNNIM